LVVRSVPRKKKLPVAVDWMGGYLGGSLLYELGVAHGEGSFVARKCSGRKVAISAIMFGETEGGGRGGGTEFSVRERFTPFWGRHDLRLEKNFSEQREGRRAFGRRIFLRTIAGGGAGRLKRKTRGLEGRREKKGWQAQLRPCCEKQRQG